MMLDTVKIIDMHLSKEMEIKLKQNLVSRSEIMASLVNQRCSVQGNENKVKRQIKISYIYDL